MLFEYYRSGKTCLGKTIYLPETDHQNWARKAARGLGAQITWELEKLLIDESILDTTIEHLHRNLNNPIHYGTAKPGSHFESGVPVVPDPRFTYLDLMGFGISGEDGYKGFLRDCGLPKSVPYTAVVLATCFFVDRRCR